MARTVTFEAFAELAEAKVKALLPEEYETFTQEVNRGTGAYHGLGIKRAGSNISPVVSLEDFYQLYESGKELDDICQKMTTALLNGIKTAEGQDANFIECVKYWEQAREKLFLRVNSAERVPQSVVHRDYEDLSVIPYVLVKKDRDGIMVAAVTKEIVRMWKQEEEAVIEAAIDNAELISPPIVRRMSDIFPAAPEEMMIISTEEGHMGACALFYRGMLEKIAEEMDGDFIVLPSSKHEVIAVPCKADGEEFKEIVESVNMTLDKDDILTSSVYRYDSEEKKLRKEA